MTLPANWTEIEMTEAGLKDRLETKRDSSPELIAWLESLLASEGYDQFAFWAAGFRDGVYTGNLNITQSPAGGTSLDGAELMLLPQAKQIPGISDVNSSRVDLPIGEALLITTIHTVSGQAGPDIVQEGRAYFLIQDDVVYGVSFSCRQDSDTCLSDAETMIRTLTITP